MRGTPGTHRPARRDGQRRALVFLVMFSFGIVVQTIAAAVLLYGLYNVVTGIYHKRYRP